MPFQSTGSTSHEGAQQKSESLVSAADSEATSATQQEMISLSDEEKEENSFHFDSYKDM